MLRGVVDRTKRLLESDEEPRTRDSADGEVSTTLYTCPECDRTYISEEMDSCSRCEVPVEPTPNKYELGIGTEV